MVVDLNLCTLKNETRTKKRFLSYKDDSKIGLPDKGKLLS